MMPFALAACGSNLNNDSNSGQNEIPETSVVYTSMSGLSVGNHTITIGGTKILYKNTYSYSGYTTVYASAKATVS